jgi:hypothetical protein
VDFHTQRVLWFDLSSSNRQKAKDKRQKTKDKRQKTKDKKKHFELTPVQDLNLSAKSILGNMASSSKTQKPKDNSQKTKKNTLNLPPRKT